MLYMHPTMLERRAKTSTTNDRQEPNGRTAVAVAGPAIKATTRRGSSRGGMELPPPDDARRPASRRTTQPPGRTTMTRRTEDAPASLTKSTQGGLHHTTRE